VPLIDGGTWRLPRIVGLGRALDLILTGREIGAAEALAMGLANRVVPEGQALPAALELAHQLSALPQLCMRADRESLYRGLGLPEAEGLREEFRRGQAALQAEGLFGAARFASGEGRHGSPAGAELGREGSRRSAAEADPDQIAGNGPRPPDGELRLIR
jgi:enoyl-CoA hydratase